MKQLPQKGAKSTKHLAFTFALSEPFRGYVLEMNHGTN
jgi:hypothetical protein